MVRDRVTTGFASRGLCFVFVCFLDPRQRSGAWNLFIYFLVFISTCHFRVRYGAAGVAVFGASLNFFFQISLSDFFCSPRPRWTTNGNRFFSWFKPSFTEFSTELPTVTHSLTRLAKHHVKAAARFYRVSLVLPSVSCFFNIGSVFFSTTRRSFTHFDQFFSFIFWFSILFWFYFFIFLSPSSRRGTPSPAAAHNERRRWRHRAFLFGRFFFFVFVSCRKFSFLRFYYVVAA